MGSPGQWDKGFSSFAGFSLAGVPYVWAYRAGDGTVCIHQINPGGIGFTQKYQYKWDTGFSGFTAVTDSAGNVYVWAYRTGDGMVCIHQINPEGNGFTQKFQYKWDTGFSGFAGFSLANVPYVWAYRAGDGTVCIHQIDAGGSGFTQKFQYKWDTAYSGFAADSDAAGNAYVWAYRADDGTVCIHQIDAGGGGFTQKSQSKWDTGFSNFAGFSYAALPYVWAYRASDGTVCIHQINPGGNGFTQVYIDQQWKLNFSGFTAATDSSGNAFIWVYRTTDGAVGILQVDPSVAGFTQKSLTKWDTGFSGLAGFSLAGLPYVWAYRSGDGTVCIHEVNPGGSGFTQKFLYKWDTGFSGFTAVTDSSGNVYVWAYRASDGMVCIHQIDAGGSGFTQKFQYKWDTGFSGFAGFSLANVPYIWAYRDSDGTVCIHQIDPGGSGFTQMFQYKWDGGFSGFTSVSDVLGNAYVWAYRAADGTACIHQIDPGGSGFQQKFLSRGETGYSGFAGFPLAEIPYVWTYRTGDGTVAIEQVNAEGNGFTQAFRYGWDGGFSNFSALTDLAANAYVWAYRASDGTVCIDQVIPGLMVRPMSPMALIQHVFVVMLENHSFDNMLAMSGIPNIAHATAANSNSYNGTAYHVHGGAPTSMPTDPGHEFLDVVEQLAGPGISYPSGGPYPRVFNNGFAANYATSGTEGPPPPAADIGDIMACFNTQTQLPVLYELATQFAVCDQWFSSLPGPTWPNRFFVHGGSSAGLDHSPSTGEILKWETVDGFTYPNGSIYDALNRAGIRWRLYNDDDNIYSPVPYRGIGGGSTPIVSALKGIDFGTVQTLSHFAGDMKYSYAPQYTFIEPNYGDVLNGTYVGGSSQHPQDGVAGGENLLAAVYEAIRNSPQWESSLLIIIYDEHGGYYDSVPPPSTVAPNDGSPNTLNQYGFTFQQLGVRVPAVVVSPWIPIGTVDHTLYDHASVPATLERLFDFPPLTQRDANASDVSRLLSLAVSRTDCPLSVARPTPSVAEARPPLTDVQQAAIDLEPLPEHGNLPGFLAIMLKTDLELSSGTPAERAAIIARFKTIHTRGQAKAYVAEVRAKVAAARAIRGRPASKAN
jgi:phospholipase C